MGHYVKNAGRISSSTSAGDLRPSLALKRSCLSDLRPTLRTLLFTALLVFAAAMPSAGTDRPADRHRPAILSRIKREPVTSSGLAAVGYSRRLRALEVEFRDGSVYRYREVPRSLYRDFLAAESKARFYNRHVRRKFPSVRVKPRRHH